MYNHASMNRVFRVVWNASLGVWQAVGEIGKGAGKGTSDSRKKRHASALAGAVFLISTQVYSASLPTNGVVSSGSGNIVQSGNTLNITQNSNKMAIDWQSFSVGKDNTVNFIQPSSSSIALNRVVGNDVSNIQGAINANGQVFLINPNGVLFSTTAQVNVGGLVASTRNITNDQFNAGNFKFEGTNSNAIINQGNIKTADGGYVVMIAAKIENTGNITANAGTVALGAGNLVTVDMGGPVKLKVEQGAINALINNGGAIQSEGGYILLTAKSAGDLAASVINNTGNIDASILTTKGGKVVLLGDDITNAGNVKADGAVGGGEVLIGGDWQGSNADLYPQATKVTLTETSNISANATQQGDGGKVVVWSDVKNASSATKVAGKLSAESKGRNTSGGKVETSGHQLNIAENTQVKTNGGEWLLDPYDFTVAATGGNITGSALGIALASGDVTITTSSGGTSCTGATCSASSTGTNGNILINDNVAWSNNKLTLSAYNDISINANLTATNNASLAFYYGQGTTTGLLNSYTVTSGKNILIPIASAFTWKKGNQGELNNLVFNNDLLRFGSGSEASINGAGLLLQPFYNDNSSWKTLTFGNQPWDFAIGYGGTSTDEWNKNGTILSTNSSNWTDSLSPEITSQVLNISKYFEKMGSITVTSTLTNGIKISNDYTLASGYKMIKATTSIENSTGADLTNARIWVGSHDDYIDGNDRPYKTKGNIGTNGFTMISNQTDEANSIMVSTESYGSTSGFSGLLYTTALGANTVFSNYGTFVSSVVNKDPKSVATSTQSADGSYGLFMNLKTLTRGQVSSATWYFGAGASNQVNAIVASIGESSGAIPTTVVPYTLSTITTGYTYNTSYQLPTEWSASSIFGNTYSSWTLGTDYNFVYNNRIITGFQQAGTYSNIAVDIIKSGFAEATTGNTIGNLTIAPKQLTITNAVVGNKTYDGTTSATLSNIGTLTGLIGNETLRLTNTTATFADKNVGTAKTVNISGYAIADGTGTNAGLASNYTLASTTATATADITPKTLTASLTGTLTKTYDGTTSATLAANNYAVSGFVTGEGASVTKTSGAYNSANVVGATTVTATLASSDFTATGSTSLSNYTLPTTASGTASITAKALTVQSATVSDKTYNGTTTATLSNVGTLSGVIGSDTVSINSANISATFASANAGTGQAVSVSGYALTGAQASNYSVTNPTGLTATINKANLTITANDFVSSASTTPSIASQSGCVGSGCITGISLSNGALGLTFASNQQASNYNTTLLVSGTGSSLTVNRPLSWSGFNLTLSSAGNININDTLTATGTSDKVTLLYGQGSVASGNTANYNFGLSDTGFTGKLVLVSGQNFSTKLGSNGTAVDYTVVNGAVELQNINNDKAGKYALGSDVTTGMTNWTRLGDSTNNFTGKFDGLGHTISGLTITKGTSTSTENDYQGLFGYATGASISNIGIETPIITAARVTGGLLGQSDATQIKNSYVKDITLTAERGLGGLVGAMKNAASVTDSFATGEIIKAETDSSYTGGLIGIIEGGSGASVSRTFADVDVYKTAGGRVVGGLIGKLSQGTLSDSYAAGTVYVGNTGIQGVTFSGAGGLVGVVGSGASITNSYATGQVVDSDSSGRIAGFVWNNSGAITNSFWDSTVNATGIGGGTTTGATGKTTEQMKTLNTFSDASWGIVYDSTLTARTPQLILDGSGTWKMNPQYIPFTLSTIATGNYTYNGTEQTPAEWNARNILGSNFSNWVLGTDYTFTENSTNKTGFTNAGTYNPVTVTILKAGYSNATTGNTDGSLVIDKAALTVKANDDAKFVVQNDNASYAGVTYTGFVNDETSSVLGGTLAIARSDNTNNNAGTYTLTPSGLSSGNYSFSYQTGTYTISAADKMIVKVGAAVNTYGSTINYGTPTVQYVAGGNVLTLNQASLTNDGVYTFAEPSASANTVSFSLSPTGATNSTSGNINVGSYSLGIANFTANTPNYTGGSAKVQTSGALQIYPKTLTVSYDAPTVTYNRSTSFTPTITPNGVVSGDDYSVTGAGTFSSMNAGNNVSYTLRLTPSGTDASNYSIRGGNAIRDTNGTINPKALTLTGTTASNKVYDGTTSATLSSNGTLTGVETGDTVTLATSGKSATFDDANVANGIAVNVSGFALSGTSAENYTLTQPTGITANITQKALTITADNRSKTYGDTLDLGTSKFTTSGLVNEEIVSEVTLTSTGAVATAGVANSPYTITPSDAVGGNGFNTSNYNITYTNGSLTVGKASLTVAANNQTKEYDGTTYSGGNGVTYTGFVNSETESVLGGTLAYNTGTSHGAQNASTTPYIITPSGYTSANYDITYSSANLTINPKQLTVSISGNPTKVYDGNTAIAVNANNFSLNGFATGEGGSVTGASYGNFNSANVADANTVSVILSSSSVTLDSGTNLSNYILPTEATGGGSITPLTLTAALRGSISKTYDGTTDATLSANNFELSGFLSGEGADVTKTAGIYNSRNVLEATTVTATLASNDFTANSGTDITNYTLPTSATGDGWINFREIIVTADAKSKSQGASDPSLTYQVTNGSLVTGDTLSGALARASGEAVGSYQIDQGTLTASDNYMMGYVAANLTITPTQAPYSPPPPTTAPTSAPTVAPTIAPTVAPTEQPTVAPTIAPTVAPTEAPTQAPTLPPAEVAVGSVIATATQSGTNAAITSNASVQALQTLATTPVSQFIQPPVIPSSGIAGGNSVAGLNGISGGLAFIEAPISAPSNNANEQGSNKSDSGTSPVTTNAGVDAAGFMRVAVVGGGINLSDSNSPASNNNQDQE